MSQADIPPVEPGIESFSNVEMQSTQMDASIKGQLSQPADVQAAHNYFQGGGSELQTGLPDLSLDSGLPQDFNTSLDLGTNQNLYGNANTLGLQGSGGEFATANLGTGGESALLNGLGPTGLEGGGLMPGLEQGVIAGMPPGTEPISPMIQMILKMPGLTGTVASFFEAIMSFLFPTDGGGFLALLDPTMWAQTAQQAFGSLVTAISDNIPLSITLMQNANPFFSTLMNNGFLQNGLFETLGKTAAAQPPDLSFTGLDIQPVDANASNMFVNGQVSPGKPLFESGAIDSGDIASGVNVSGNGDLLAFDNGNSFGATMGGYSPTTSVDPQSMTTSTATSTAAPAPQADVQQSITDSSPAQTTDTANATTYQRGDLLKSSESRAGQSNGFETPGDHGNEIASNNLGVQPESYTVHQGDNLWNIARDHLGSGTKWTEIYQLNANVIGDNPNLIFSGSELQLPPSIDNIASAHNYVVQPGDNLWNIAKENMGQGSQWPSLYHQNADIIGSDPNLIHPGQNLAMSGQNPGSVHFAHHQAPATHHSAPAHSTPKVAHHARHGNTHHNSQSKTSSVNGHGNSTEAAQKHHDTTDNTSAPASDTLATDTTADTILKQAQNTAASSKDHLEKTASAAQPSPMGLRAVAKSLDI